MIPPGPSPSFVAMAIPPPLPYQAHVDALRAIAVVGVVLFHLGVPWVPGGYVGVDVFFVISGYLITRLLREEFVTTGRLNLPGFYLRRIRRLLSALLVMLALTSLVAVAVMSPKPMERFGASLVFAPLGLANLFFWQEAGYFDAGALSKPLLHTWSLGVEEQFYLLWPALLIGLFIAAAPQSRRWLAPSALCAVGVLSLLANLWVIDYGQTVQSGEFEQRPLFQNAAANLFYLMPFRVYEFVLGALLVWMPGNQLPRWANTLVVLLGLAAVVGAMGSFDDNLWFPGYLAVLPCVGTAALIYCGAHGWRPGVLANPVLVWVGLLSYSLYLYHWPVLVFWDYLKLEAMAGLDQTGVLVLSVLAAVGSYYLIERPFRRPAAGAQLGLRRTAALMVSVLLLVWLGNSLVLSAGWASRSAPLDPAST